MTGVGGRPEVIIEGSNNYQDGWKAYEFLYKPGNVSTMPPIVGQFSSFCFDVQYQNNSSHYILCNFKI